MRTRKRSRISGSYLTGRQGLSKKLKIKKRIICPECAGVGTKDKANAFVCRQCGGEGKQVRLLQAGMLVQQVLTFAYISIKSQLMMNGKYQKKKKKKSQREGETFY
jgi:RecJ-like exonuclease